MAYLTDDAVTWKTEIRERIMQNLANLLHDAQLDYLRRVSESRITTMEARNKLFSDYNREVQTLQSLAEEEIKTEIDREERERNVEVTGNLDQAFVKEQLAILKAIREQPKVVSSDTGKGHLRQSSFSRQFDAELPHIGHPNLVQSSTIVSSVSESPAERQARLKMETHRKQQEEFRQRAEKIQERKKREREDNQERDWNSQQLQFAETMSCSSSSSSNTATTSDQDKSDGMPTMSEDDVVNLMIFHDQQWTWISSLPHLQWSDFPWPCLIFAGPKRKEDLTPEAIAEYVQAQFNIHRDRTIVKEHLKNLIRRWHPDRFEIKYLSRIADLHERDTVRDGAGTVTRILNDLLGKWNVQ